MILLDPQAHPVIAHRGNRAFAPENTLVAFEQALALGADALEFDLQLSRDGVLMVIHDATLERCTDGRGSVREHTAAQLAQLDAGAKFTPDGGRSFPWRGRGVRLSRFDEIIESLPRALPCIVELKHADAGEPMRQAIRRHAIADRLVVAGFDAAATQPLHGTGVALGASTRDVLRALPRALLGLPAPPAAFQALCIPPRHHGIPVPVAALARSLRKARAGVTHVWTVNDEVQALRLWRCGVQGLIGDDPALLLRARARLESS